MSRRSIKIPDGKDFIFSIFDDTDVSTLDNIRPVYDYLTELGIYTTKSVWPMECAQQNSNYKGSHTLQDKEYAAYVKELARRGFEIAYHGASMESSPRAVIIESLRQFRQILGFSPRTYASHACNRENIYWGDNRFNFSVFRFLYRMLNPRKDNFYSGNNLQSQYFWADICRETFDYVRTFTFNDINLLNISRFPYTVKNRPCFNKCFLTSSADNVKEFNRLLSEVNQEKLQVEKGVCIITTHFGKGFTRNNKLDSTTKILLKRLADKNGYFAPVCNVMDYLTSIFGSYQIKNWELFVLEYRWFLDTFYRKLNRLKYEQTELKYLDVS